MKTNKTGRSSLLGISIVVFLICFVHKRIKNNGIIPAKRTQIPVIKKNDVVVVVKLRKIKTGIETIGAAVNREIKCAILSIELLFFGIKFMEMLVSLLL
ncbi:hypothetical protein [uncultured Methanoregula sp.]|uniref:hypothetical protein n=1 Tax=uncultured Methanoregula sp. TaxID=1005933 RepID=UPI002AAB0820|nr:hypothetical protein [uncultured Methanoregula sp.]